MKVCIYWGLNESEVLFLFFFLLSTLTPACHHTTCPKFGAFALFTLIGFESCSPDLFSIQHCILVPYSPDVAASLSSVYHQSPVNDPHILALGSLCFLLDV